MSVFHLTQKAQGRSLLPLIRQNSTSLRRSWWRIFHSFRKKEDFSFAEQREEKIDDYSIVKGNYQLIYNLKSKSTRLFNIKNDPLAQNNITDNHEALVKQLLSKLINMYTEIPKYKTSTFTLDKQTREQLEELGYINDRKDTTGKAYEPSQIENY